MSVDTRRLTRCLTFIKENTTQVEKILDILIEDEIIGLEERAQVLASPLLENQLHSVIETVVRKQAQKSFIEALKTTGNKHVADRILATPSKNELNEINKEKTFVIQKQIADDQEEKLQNDMYIKEKTLEELKLENDRLKSQQSFVREQLNEKHRKIQELKLEISNYKRQNTDLNEQLKSYGELQLRMQDIEKELSDKEKMNTMIEIALCERSEEIFRLQNECADLRTESEKKSEQISNLNDQMEALKSELKKASQDRERLELKVVEMSAAMDDKFSKMMNAMEDLKGGYRHAQCEVTTPRSPSTPRQTQIGRRGQSSYLPKQRSIVPLLSSLKTKIR